MSMFDVLEQCATPLEYIQAFTLQPEKADPQQKQDAQPEPMARPVGD